MHFPISPLVVDHRQQRNFSLRNGATHPSDLKQQKEKGNKAPDIETTSPRETQKETGGIQGSPPQRMP